MSAQIIKTNAGKPAKICENGHADSCPLGEKQRSNPTKPLPTAPFCSACQALPKSYLKIIIGGRRDLSVGPKKPHITTAQWKILTSFTK